MIKYKLQCRNLHHFESWFSSSSAYEKLNNGKLLSCEICGSNSISKSLMSPSVNSKEKEPYKEVFKSKPNKEQILLKELKTEASIKELISLRNKDTLGEVNFEARPDFDMLQAMDTYQSLLLPTMASRTSDDEYNLLKENLA